MPRGIPNKVDAPAKKKRRRKKAVGTRRAAAARNNGISVTHAELGTIVGNAMKAVLAE